MRLRHRASASRTSNARLQSRGRQNTSGAPVSKGNDMNAHIPLDSAAVAAANAMMDRLHPLADTITNARGFRALLEDLHDRNLSGVQEPHVSAIRLMRAAVLRSAIASIMACVD